MDWLITRKTLFIYEVHNCDDFYILAASDNGIFIECVIAKTNTTDVNDYENNYRSNTSLVFYPDTNIVGIGL